MTRIISQNPGLIDAKVTGPNSSVDNNIATYDGVTGKVIKDSGVGTSGISGSVTAHSDVTNAGSGQIITGAERGILNSALQSGDNVSELVNDSGYLTSISGLNHSSLSLDDGSNPHGTTKGDVGLANADNTSDLGKPISTATQNALDGKVSSVIAGTGISVDNTDSENPIVINSAIPGISVLTDAQILAIPSPTEGLYVHSSDSGMLFQYDATRSKFLTVESLPLEFADNNNSDNRYIRFGGNASDGNSGARMPFDGTITRITIKGSNTANKNIDLEINGAQVDTFTTAAGVFSDTTLDIDIDETDRLNMFTQQAGPPIQDPYVVVWVKFRL